MKPLPVLGMLLVVVPLACGHAWQGPALAAQPSPVLAQARPGEAIVLEAGDLEILFQRSAEGLRLERLRDRAALQTLSQDQTPPLFTLVLRLAGVKEDLRLRADAGWDQIDAARPTPGGPLEIRWGRAKDPRLAGLKVIARASPDRASSAIAWKLDVSNQAKDCAIRRVVFPEVGLAAPGPQAEVLTCRAAGEILRGLWQRKYNLRSTYPAGWNGSMQFLAAYDAQRKTGLYLAMHDPQGSTKDIVVESRPDAHSVVFAIDHPAPGMNRPGNAFSLSGEAVWQLLRGDWFDAAVIYRDWARRHAAWYPKLTAEGRADTPLWLRELPVWVMAGGGIEHCEKEVMAFAKAMGVPVGFHWYNWHQIPFDNDYPHYFPAKDGFQQAVGRLQAAGVYAMPYINGRLWDTRDRENQDFEFSRVALPAATKDEQGKPYTESYGSKEKDGTPVRLAVMCPSTEAWQSKVRQTVLRLFGDCGVKAVYIDQIAAAAPRLCFDPAHGHPLGGGHWWNTSYWNMLEPLRRSMPKDRALTSECNAEPFVNSFDAYLTWHWQNDGQVPAFPAVYGGAIQMFGRAYRGGPTKDLAFRMKAGQQLVFGEQIGWFSPDVHRQKENLDFLREVVGLRWQLRRYFYAGEMARPPRLEGSIPTVRADWQWSGPTWITTDAVLIGAWRLPKENRLAVLAVNMGDQAAKAKLAIDTGAYGLAGQRLRVTDISPQGAGTSAEVSRIWQSEIQFLPGKAMAWEFSGSP